MGCRVQRDEIINRLKKEEVKEVPAGRKEPESKEEVKPKTEKEDKINTEKRVHKNMVKSLPKFGSQRIVYVSCNPTTQARDLIQLIHWGWKLQSMTLVDMFPHTPHIETVALLTK